MDGYTSSHCSTTCITQVRHFLSKVFFFKNIVEIENPNTQDHFIQKITIKMIKFMLTTVSKLRYNGLINTIMKTVEKKNQLQWHHNRQDRRRQEKKEEQNQSILMIITV